MVQKLKFYTLHVKPYRSSYSRILVKRKGEGLI
jgi:hypothetical protein